MYSKDFEKLGMSLYHLIVLKGINLVCSEYVSLGGYRSRAWHLLPIRELYYYPFLSQLKYQNTQD